VNQNHVLRTWFFFNAITQQRSSGSISTLYTKYAISLSDTKSHDEIQIIFSKLKKSLIHKLPDFNEFEASFSNIEFLNNKTRNKNLLKYILARFMKLNSTGISVDINTMTIEHLLPQANINNENEQFIGSIGNLILVDTKTNSEELKDHSFEKKREILLSKKYPLDDCISNASSWNISDIEARTKILCKNAYERLWRI